MIFVIDLFVFFFFKGFYVWVFFILENIKKKSMLYFFSLNGVVWSRGCDTNDMGLSLGRILLDLGILE